jgi:hypothetical protein
MEEIKNMSCVIDGTLQRVGETMCSDKIISFLHKYFLSCYFYESITDLFDMWVLHEVYDEPGPSEEIFNYF